MEDMKKFFSGLFAVLVLLVAVGGGAYIVKGDSSLFDPLYSPQEQLQRKNLRASKEFPTELGNYTLYSRGAFPIGIERDCNTLNGADSCQEILTGEYHQVDGSGVVFIRIATVVEGNKNDVKEYLRKSGTFESLSPYPYQIMRFEHQEISWFPRTTHDFIVTQEGVYTMRADGTESVSYPNKATGNNAVTAYFIQKYPPPLQ
jgi:hypothetical protein